MKKLIYILMLLSPIMSFTQQNVLKSPKSDLFWQNVGDAGFSAGLVRYSSFAFSPSGEPYVAYCDYANLGKVTVMKFDGTNWMNVGNAGFSADTAEYTSLAISQSGQPYVAYQDYGNSKKATVMKFDGTNWVNVGMSGFSTSRVYEIVLALNQSGQPYVAYCDNENSFQTTVMKYDFPIGINEAQNIGLSFYPNPATSEITIGTFGISAKCQLSIMNVNGQVMIARQITEPKTQVDISNLPNGIYFVRLTSGKSVEVVKFVKQ